MYQCLHHHCHKKYVRSHCGYWNCKYSYPHGRPIIKRGKPFWNFLTGKEFFELKKKWAIWSHGAGVFIIFLTLPRNSGLATGLTCLCILKANLRRDGCILTDYYISVDFKTYNFVFKKGAFSERCWVWHNGGSDLSIDSGGALRYI